MCCLMATKVFYSGDFVIKSKVALIHWNHAAANVAFCDEAKLASIP